MARKLILFGLGLFLITVIIDGEQYSTQAQDQPFTARIIPASGQPFIIENFNKRGKRYYRAQWRGSNVML